MAYSGLETLFQNLGPTTASMFAGEREGLAQQADLLAQAQQIEANRKAQLANRQTLLTDPLEVKQKQLANETVSATLPGIIAKARSLVVDANVDEATQDSKIVGTNAENQGKVSKEAYEKFTRMSDITSKMGVMLQSIPPAAQTSAKLQFLSENGLNADSQMGKFVLQAAPEQLIDMSKKFAQMSQQYITADMQRRSAEEVARSNRASAERIAQMNIDAGRFAPKATSGKTVRSPAERLYENFQKASPKNRIGILYSAIQTGINPFTQEPLTEAQLQQFKFQYDQDSASENAYLARGSQPGIAPSMGPQGMSLENKVPPTVAPKPAAGNRKPLSAY